MHLRLHVCINPLRYPPHSKCTINLTLEPFSRRLHFLSREKSDRVRVDTEVVRVLGLAGSVDSDHVGDTNGVVAVDVQRRNTAVNTEDLALAVLGTTVVRATSVVVVEEAVQTDTVQREAGAVGDTETESVAVTLQAGAEVRVVPGRVGGVWARGGVRRRLVVRSLSLEVTTNNVGGTVELELVQAVVLRTSSPPVLFMG